MRRLAALLVGLLLVPQLSVAQVRAISATAWTVTGNDIVFSYTFPQTLAAALVSPGAPSPPTQVIARYVFSKVSAQRQGKPCEAVDQGYDLGRIDTRYAGPGLVSFEIFFRCASDAAALVLRNDAFFDRVPAQVGIVHIRVGDLPPVSRLITAGNTAIIVGTGAAAVIPGRWSAYAGLGLRETFTGLVSLCTATGLLLLIRSRRELLALAVALFAGYLAAASAASAGGWTLNAEPLRAFGGFLVLLVGALFATRRSGRPFAVASAVAAISAVVAATVALLGHGAAALCLAGAGVFGALSLCLQSEAFVARWFPLVPALLVGAMAGFSLASLFAPLRPVVTPGVMAIFANGAGVLLGILLIFAALAGARILLRRHAGLLRAPVCGDLLAASLAAVGVLSMLTV